jgi:hypothetical protein
MDADKPFPLSKGVIWLLCLGLTPLCGAILYYVWKKDNLPAAKYANNVSWLSWFMWIGGYLVFFRHGR